MFECVWELGLTHPDAIFNLGNPVWEDSTRDGCLKRVCRIRQLRVVCISHWWGTWGEASLASFNRGYLSQVLQLLIAAVWSVCEGISPVFSGVHRQLCKFLYVCTGVLQFFMWYVKSVCAPCVCRLAFAPLIARWCGGSCRPGGQTSQKATVKATEGLNCYEQICFFKMACSF